MGTRGYLKKAAIVCGQPALRVRLASAFATQNAGSEDEFGELRHEVSTSRLGS